MAWSSSRSSRWSSRAPETPHLARAVTPRVTVRRVSRAFTGSARRAPPPCSAARRVRRKHRQDRCATARTGAVALAAPGRRLAEVGSPPMRSHLRPCLAMLLGAHLAAAAPRIASARDASADAAPCIREGTNCQSSLGGCCTGLVCRSTQPGAALTCELPTDASVCASYQDDCGDGVTCCGGLTCAAGYCAYDAGASSGTSSSSCSIGASKTTTTSLLGWTAVILASLACLRRRRRADTSLLPGTYPLEGRYERTVGSPRRFE